MKYRVGVRENKEAREEFEVEAISPEQARRLAVAYMRQRRDTSEDFRTYVVENVKEINEIQSTGN